MELKSHQRATLQRRYGTLSDWHLAYKAEKEMLSSQTFEDIWTDTHGAVQSETDATMVGVLLAVARQMDDEEKIPDECPGCENVSWLKIQETPDGITIECSMCDYHKTNPR